MVGRLLRSHYKIRIRISSKSYTNLRKLKQTDDLLFIRFSFASHNETFLQPKLEAISSRRKINKD